MKHRIERPPFRSHVFHTHKTVPKEYLGSINTLTLDTKESRRLFDALNKHCTSGVVKGKHPDAVAMKIPSGADTDITMTNLGAPGPVTVSDDGGRRMEHAKVYVVFWGDQWVNNPPTNPSLDDILNDIAAILASPYLAGTNQYKCGQATFEKAWIDKRDTPPYAFSMVDINYEAWLMMTSGPISADSDTIVCVIMPPGVGHNSDIGGHLNGEHARSLQPDCQWVPTMWVKYGTRAQMSTTFSHELVETMTDPEGDAIQVNPRDDYSWHEIADVCEGRPGLVNGVTVESYWSAKDNACVIPNPVPVTAWQITCIRKRGTHSNPNQNIKYVGGVHQPSGKKFAMKQEDVIKRIDKGDRFLVVGADGSQADVKVFIHFPPWQPQGSRYIATVADDSTDDNLLSMPDCTDADLSHSQ